MQERVISQFCEMQGINLANIFVDSDNDTGGKLTWLPSDNQPFYTEGKLLKSWIQEGKIDCIYVDSEIRLKVAYSHPDDFWKLCHDRDIRIIEIFLDDKISESKGLQRTVGTILQMDQRRDLVWLVARCVLLTTQKLFGRMWKNGRSKRDEFFTHDF